jgi:hypothetical protein
MQRKVHKLKRTVSQLGKALDAKVLLHNKTTKKLKNVHKSNSKAQQENKALKKKVNRFGKHMEHACERTQKLMDITKVTKVLMKEKGRHTEKFKALYRTLLDHGVSNEKVDSVIHSVYKAADIEVTDHVSGQAVSCANTKGLIQAELQIAVELLQTDRECGSQAEFCAFCHTHRRLHRLL